MSVIVPLFADASPYLAAVFGLAGSLIGGAIAGTVSLKVARDARDAAERSWVRDSRRAIYDRFLAAGQRLLVVLETARTPAEVPEEVLATIDAAYATFFETYASVQTVAELGVVQTARVQAYRLQALKDILDGRGPSSAGEFDRISQLVRLARQDTIDAMRADLGLHGSARPQADQEYAEAVFGAAHERPPRDASP
jgi:hypothetical protein